MKLEDLKKIIDEHGHNRPSLEQAIKSAFGDRSPYVWGSDNEIDWGDGWWTSIYECVGDNSEEHEAYSYLAHPDEIPSIPLIFDSPHSGTDYPADFEYTAPKNILRLCEDSFVDSIIQDNVLKGVAVLKAKFPRSYIDPNRAESCLHPADIKGGIKSISAKSDFNAANGRGLIWMRAQKSAIYTEDQKPTEQDIANRIDRYYRPYHSKLAQLVADTKDKHGFAYHINWHSCPRFGSPTHRDPKKKRADFILGDRNGKTFDPILRDRIKSYLESKGYSVAINKPYKGAEIVKRYGKPADNVFSLQIEICRDLYMDEVTLEPHEGIRQLSSDLKALTDDMAAYIKDRSLEFASIGSQHSTHDSARLKNDQPKAP